MLKVVEVTERDILRQLKTSLKAPGIIDDVLMEMVIEEEVEKYGITASKGEIQSMADSFRVSKKLDTVNKTLKWMHDHWMSIDDLERIAYVNVVSGKLARHLFECKVEQHYHVNHMSYFRAVVYEIVFDNENLAMEYYYAIRGGEIEFHKVATIMIADKELRRNGGYMGTLSRKELNPEISSAVFACENATLLKPIKTSKGIHLIFVEEVTRTDLNDDLQSQIMLELYSDWLINKIRELGIKIIDFQDGRDVTLEKTAQ
jgi:PPIC-type PPIASE domain